MRGYLIAWLFVALVTGEAFAQAPPAPNPQDDPYIRELVRRSRGSNELLATSISDALRLKLDNYASDFLASLATRNLNAEQLATLTRQISAERLLRVVVEEQFTAPAKAQAAAMLETLRTFDQSVARIAPAIAKLSAASPDERLSALRTVLAGGEQSIALLSVAAAKEADVSKRDELLRVMLRLGNGGRAAVRQLAIYGTDTLRAGALSALIRLGAAQAAPVVAAAAHDPNATAEEQSISHGWLIKRYSAVGTREDAEAFLMDRIAMAREATTQVQDPEATVTLWTISEDRESVTFSNVKAIDAAWREVIDHARLLHRVGRLSDEAIRVGLSAELAYRYQIDPLSLIEAKKELSTLWGESSVSPAMVGEMIEDAIERDDLTVAVAATELIDASMVSQAEALMTTYSEVLAPLVKAASHDQQRLRYHAAAAIGRLGFEEPYAGSSYVMERWIEMVTLDRDPVILLLETRMEVESQIERVLTSMGYRIEVVYDVAEAVMTIDRGGDIRYLISTTVLPDYSAIELVDRVRRRPLGGSIPILLHGPVDLGVDAAVNDVRWTAPVELIELPASAAGWSLVFEAIEATRKLPPLSSVERLDFRRASASALGAIASKPDTFGFYEFEKLEGAGVSGITSAGESSSVAFGEPVLAVLSIAGSSDAQSALAELAMRDNIPPARREKAAEALLFSIKRDGVLLTNSDLLRIVQTRRMMDSDQGKSIDPVLTEIGRRTDEGKLGAGSLGDEKVSKP